MIRGYEYENKVAETIAKTAQSSPKGDFSLSFDFEDGKVEVSGAWTTEDGRPAVSFKTYRADFWCDRLMVALLLSRLLQERK